MGKGGVLCKPNEERERERKGGDKVREHATGALKERKVSE